MPISPHRLAPPIPAQRPHSLPADVALSPKGHASAILGAGNDRVTRRLSAIGADVTGASPRRMLQSDTTLQNYDSIVIAHLRHALTATGPVWSRVIAPELHRWTANGGTLVTATITPHGTMGRHAIPPNARDRPTVLYCAGAVIRRDPPSPPDDMRCCKPQQDQARGLGQLGQGTRASIFAKSWAPPTPRS